MKIALLTDGIFPYVVGGMQKHSYYLCKFLAQRGVDIDLYHTNLQDKYDIDQLEFFTEEEKKHIHSTVIPFPKGDRLPGHYLRASFKYSEAVYAALEKRPAVDFIYSKGLAAWKLLKEKKKKKKKFPPISNKAHGYEMFQIHPNLKSRLGNYMMRPAFLFNAQQADYIFSYGGNISTILTKDMSVKKEAIVEIPTGIESKWLREKSLDTHTPRKFVFLGRYERRKGIEELSQVLKELLPDKNLNFEFIGPFDKQYQIDSPKIKYHGLLTDVTKIRSILQDADVLVCPSYSEGMPNVIMEGMASGCAVIATNVGAVPIQVSDENGWLIPPANQSALKKAIIEVTTIDDTSLLKKRKTSIQKIKDHFLWETIIDKTIEEIQQILEKNKKTKTLG